jgi:pimeloyl-ACP methyl ester carboxylesterase
MALVTVNAKADGLDCDEAAMAAALAALPPGAPVVVMIHGYRFMPGQPGHCPHEHILSLRPTPGVPRAVSWPQELGLGADEAGLAIAFGWSARGALRASYARAASAGGHLAALVLRLRALAPDRPVDVIAHSLGARVVLQALPLLSPGDLARIILLSPAEFRAPATMALHSPAGRAAEVLSVTSRANGLFDFLLEMLAAGGIRRSVSRGFCKPCPNWTQLHIDDPAAMTALADLGFPLGAPTGRICHWSPYLRPGLFALYRAILARRIAPASLRVARPVPAPHPRPRGMPLPGSPA